MGPEFPLISIFAIPALSVFLLGIALVVGLSNKRQPSILATIFIMMLVSVHIVQIVLAIYQPAIYRKLFLTFAYIPMRYVAAYEPPWAPGGLLAYLWSPFSSALLHTDGPHLFFNGIGLFIFGRTIAWRLGRMGFLLVFAASSVAGAVAHTVFYWGSTVPAVGASAGVFGAMGATFRFVPKSDDRLKALFWPDEKLRQLPITGILELVTERRSLTYVLLCFVIFPLGLTALIAGISGNTAVIAHVGGFALGVFGIRYFDRSGRLPQPERPVETEFGQKAEPRGLKMLRALAVLMMVAGILMGILGYWLPALVF